MNQDAVIIICTRPDSSRLPEKVFKPLAGVPAIEILLRRLKGCGIPIVLAVPESCTRYDYLAPFYKVKIYRGEDSSPLHRTTAAMAKLYPEAKYAIRITHDDILIDKHTMLKLLDECWQNGAGYGCTPSIVEGAGVEIIHVDNLKNAVNLLGDASTEFISYFVKNGPNKKNVTIQPRPMIRRDYRLTMDYPEDAIVLSAVFNAVGHDAPLDEIVRYLDEHSSLLNLNRQPLVTLYTCAYNARPYVLTTLKSIVREMNSPGINIEYIFIDDCSTDGTIEDVALCQIPGFRVFQNDKNIGLSASSNLAIDRARGRYVMRVDADDWLRPGAVANLLHHIELTGAGAVYAAYQEADSKGLVGARQIDPRENHHAGCAMMDKRLLNEIRFTDSLRHFDSMDLHKRMKEKGAPIAYTDAPLWFYRRHSKNMSLPSAEREAAKRQLGLPEGYTTTSATIEAIGAANYFMNGDTP